MAQRAQQPPPEARGVGLLSDILARHSTVVKWQVGQLGQPDRRRSASWRCDATGAVTNTASDNTAVGAAWGAAASSSTLNFFQDS